jgi:hypothetical protein
MKVSAHMQQQHCLTRSGVNGFCNICGHYSHMNTISPLAFKARVA